MKELIELFAEKVGRYPRGNVQDELRSWAANEITTLRQQLAEVTGCACSSEGPCKYHAMTSVSGRSYVLRKQAEAVDEVNRKLTEISEGMDGRGMDPVLVMQYAASTAGDEAKRLRQQADEAERAGGENA